MPGAPEPPDQDPNPDPAVFPEGYRPKLGLWDTERGIKVVKDVFLDELKRGMGLIRVTSPRFLETGHGLQDDLAGTQEPVGFHTRFTDARVEMVHSLAKWKRHALGRYGFEPGEGIVTDMDAVRKDEVPSPIHSIYVDQWDWERVITPEQRTLAYLRDVVTDLYATLRATERWVVESFEVLEPRLPESITFLHAGELARQYPGLSPRDREHRIAREHGAVFLQGIGHPLETGEPHDLRAADYDDWSTPTERGPGLNGDILVWDDIRGAALELSSMGIRVDAEALDRQLSVLGQEDRRELDFHRAVLDGELPQSVGGGIGQSRLCMLFLHKAHIGEVQASVWPEDVEREFERQGVPLL